MKTLTLNAQQSALFTVKKYKKGILSWADTKKLLKAKGYCILDGKRRSSSAYSLAVDGGGYYIKELEVQHVIELEKGCPASHAIIAVLK